MAAPRLRPGAGVLLRAGGVSPGGADHRGGGRVGRGPGPRRDPDRAVPGAADARRGLRRRLGEPHRGRAEVPAAGGHLPGHAAGRGGPVPRGPPGAPCGRVLLEPGADGHAHDQEPDGGGVQHVPAGLPGAGLHHRVRVLAGPAPGAPEPGTPVRSDPRASDRRPPHLPVPHSQRLHLCLRESRVILRPHLPLLGIQLLRVRPGLLAGLPHRHAAGPAAARGPHPQDLCQEPSVRPQDTFPSAEERQRREKEKVKETTPFFNVFSIFKGKVAAKEIFTVSKMFNILVNNFQ